MSEPHLKPLLQIEEIPDRLDEQHIFTTQTLGFLIHPSITFPPSSPTLKIADVGTGTGIWLIDVAKTLPSTLSPTTHLHLTGYDLTSDSLPTLPPSPSTLPLNTSLDFRIHDFRKPFPTSELGTYDLIAVRFVSSATTRADWTRTVTNLTTLLKPGTGWLQWIDSTNFAVYNSVPGTSRLACREIYDGLEPFRSPNEENGTRKGGGGEEELVIGLMMREQGNTNREEIWKQVGLLDVHEDVFSSDRLQDAPGLKLRDKAMRNIVECFTQVLGELVGVEGSGWTRERIERVKREAMREVDQGVYHTLDQVCIIGRRAG